MRLGDLSNHGCRRCRTHTIESLCSGTLMARAAHCPGQWWQPECLRCHRDATLRIALPVSLRTKYDETRLNLLNLTWNLSLKISHHDDSGHWQLELEQFNSGLKLIARTRGAYHWAAAPTRRPPARREPKCVDGQGARTCVCAYVMVRVAGDLEGVASWARCESRSPGTVAWPGGIIYTWTVPSVPCYALSPSPY